MNTLAPTHPQFSEGFMLGLVAGICFVSLILVFCCP